MSFFTLYPNDTLFFRDGKPFTMGTSLDSSVNLIFPPYPSTLYGIVRSWLISANCGFDKFYRNGIEESLKNILGTKSEKGNLKIKGPFISQDNTPYFPLPLDGFCKSKDKFEVFKLFNKPNIIISDYNLDKVFLNKDDKKIEEKKGLISDINLKDYLSGNTEILFSDTSEFFKIEYKTGIKKDRTKNTTQKSHLYTLPMIRLMKGCGISFMVEDVDNLNMPQESNIRLGGEAKTARIKKANNDLFSELKTINLDFNNKIFKIYLATPAMFKNGWLPDWIGDNYEGEYSEIKLKLLTCFVGKYIPIGGWDMANGEPKPMYKAVPAGSVYYFEVLDNSDLNKIKDAFHLKNISDINPEEGFGLTLVGGVNI